MLSEEQIKRIQAQGLEIIIVEGITMVQDCAESAMERHAVIPIVGNTESHKKYNKLLQRISRHKQFDIPIPDELSTEVTRIATEIRSNTEAARIAAELKEITNKIVVPRIGK